MEVAIGSATSVRFLSTCKTSMGIGETSDSSDTKRNYSLGICTSGFDACDDVANVKKAKSEQLTSLLEPAVRVSVLH